MVRLPLLCLFLACDTLSLLHRSAADPALSQLGCSIRPLNFCIFTSFGNTTLPPPRPSSLPSLLLNFSRCSPLKLWNAGLHVSCRRHCFVFFWVVDPVLLLLLFLLLLPAHIYNRNSAFASLHLLLSELISSLMYNLSL